MANYVDGFVLPVPRDKVEAYREMAHAAGKVTSFPQAVDLKDDEVVVFSWIVYASREERDRINAKVMEDPRIKASMDGKTCPFDPQRMIYGGFTTLVALDP